MTLPTGTVDVASIARRARPITKRPRRRALYDQRMLERWGHSCIVCGQGFTNPASITREHCMPRARLGRGKAFRASHDNVAPSHYVCNQLRKNMSLLRVQPIINKLLERMTVERAREWLATPVPNRIDDDDVDEELRDTAVIATPVIDPAILARVRPGALIRFKSHSFVGFGTVVAQHCSTIIVLWDEKCNNRLATYDVRLINWQAIHVVLT